MHHRMSLSSVSEAVISKTPSRPNLSQVKLNKSHILVTLDTKEKKPNLCCAALYGPLRVSAVWRTHKTLGVVGHGSEPADWAEQPGASGVGGQMAWW